MDFLNNSTAQLRDLFGSMTPGARITAGLLLIVVVVSLGYLFLEHGYGPDAYLLNGQVFPAMQISSMQSAFAQAGLSGYQIENGQIRVPRGKSHEFMAALVEYDALPQQFGEALDKALATSGLWVDTKQREELLKAAKQKELVLTISAMKGIHSAMVLVDMKTKPGFRKEEMHTASVNLVLTGSEPIESQRALLIRKSVAKSFAGMKPEDVVVTDSNGGIHGGTSDPSTPGGGDENLHMARMKSYQNDWEQKVSKALFYVDGAIVTANVDLDLDRRYLKKEVTYDAKTVPHQSTTSTRSKESDSVDPGGRPGYESQVTTNQGASLSTAQSRKMNETEEESDEHTINALPGTEVQSEKEGLTPKRVTVDVAVPSSYFRTVWNERNPTEPNEEPKKPDPAMLEEIRTQEVANIEKCVANLLPLPLGVTDRTELVNITVFQDIKPDEIPAIGMSEKAMTWLGQSWSTIGLILLAGFSLLMLRSMIRSVPAPPPTPGPVISASIEAEEEGEGEGSEQPTTVAGRSSRAGQMQFNTTGASLRDELSELVGEDPDAAANILRNWIGNIN